MHAFKMGLSALALHINVVFSSRLHLHDSTFTPDHILRISDGVLTTACNSRPSVLVNGTSPGPEIRLREDNTSWIRVYNDMNDQNLTIHWHGLSQSTAPFSDGTPQASQWPIAPQHFFDYELHPSIGEAGTYLYHSHVGFQASSAAGPLIVEEAGQHCPYDYDEERMMFLSEFFNQTDPVVEHELISVPLGFTGEAEAILVNGKSYAATDAQGANAPPPWTPPPANVASLTCSPEVIDVQPNTTYRFRTIGGVAIGLYAIQFEHHDNLTVIAADGQYTQPAYTDRIQIGSGQRYDFLLHTMTTRQLELLNQSMFWIQLNLRYRTTNLNSYAVLRYNSKQQVPSSPPSSPPLSITDDIQSWLEYDLKSLAQAPFPSLREVSRTVVLNSLQLSPNNTNPDTSVIGPSGHSYWTTNGRIWTENNEHLNNTAYTNTSASVGVPYLVDIYRRGEAAIPNYKQAAKNNGYDPQLNVYAAQVGEVIDIVLYNMAAGIVGGYDNHPWHIHGGHVWDLGSGPGTYDAAANEAKLQQRLGGQSPALRDTTMLYKAEDNDNVGNPDPEKPLYWRAWRLRVQDAGVWMVHCHILQHMIMGMQTVWVMGDAAQIRAKAGPFVEGYLQFGGSAYGREGQDPFVYHYFDD